MKLSTIKPDNPISVVNAFNIDGNLGRLTNQEYIKLAQSLKILQETQEVLDKLGHLLIVGLTQIERKIASAFEAISQSDIEDTKTIDKKVSAFEKQFREYSKWIEQNNRTLTPFELRQYINDGKLKRKDLLALARFLSSRQSDSNDDRGKLELLFSKLCEEIDEKERSLLLTDLFPEVNPLSQSEQQTLDQLRKLTAEIKSLFEFPMLVEGRYLIQARFLKLTLGSALWHREGLSATCGLNLTLKDIFYKLLEAECRFIIAVCHKLKYIGINSLDELDDGSILDIDATMRFTESAQELLDENYYTNIQNLQRLATIGRWMREAIELISTENVLMQSSLTEKEEVEPKPAEEPLFDLISTFNEGINVLELETQLSTCLKEITGILMSRPNKTAMETINLRHTILLLGNFEMQAILSQGNLLESRLKLHENKLIRRSVSLVAELQECAALFAEGKEQSSSKYYSISSISYYLEQSQRMQGELEILSQTSRQNGDIETAISILELRSKLQNVNNRNWKILAELFPMIKFEGIAQ
jgi:hypothetical protein